MSDKIRRKKVFISGPMSGVKDFNKPAFDQAEKELTECGLAVFNPAWMQFEPYSWKHGEIMKIDLAALAQCDYIYMLDGWEESTGAKQEYNYAMSIGVKSLRKVSDGFVCGDNSFKRPTAITRIEIESFGDISGRNLEFLQWLEKHCNEILAEGRSLTGDILSWTTETVHRQHNESSNKLCANCKYHYEDSEEPCNSCNDKSKWEPKDAPWLSEKLCAGCKYHKYSVNEEPCKSCNPVLHNGWEDPKPASEKSCNTCKYYMRPLFEEPCNSCNAMCHTNWDPKDAEK